MIYRLLNTIIRVMSHIPFPVSQFLGKALGTAIVLLSVDRISISLDNIRKSFGDSMNNSELKKLNMKVLIHFCRMFFEIPHILRLTHENLDRYVWFSNQDSLLMALAKGKGVFILTGHFGNWELMAAATTLSFGKSAVVARPIDFNPMDQVVNNLRSRFGTEIIPKQKSMRKIMKAVKEKKIVGILLDQNVDWYEGVFIKFLGRWACVNKGLALMALKTNTPVIPAFSVRQKDGRFRIIFGDEVQLIRTGDKTRDVEDNTARFTAIIEKYIRKYPDQWFWFHRRWKTRPYCRIN